jgi:hypothetical protein
MSYNPQPGIFHSQLFTVERSIQVLQRIERGIFWQKI